MPYLRNPVGPLPSSIYWRRRLVVLVVLAAVLALLLWLLLGGGGGGAKPDAAGSSSHPAASITPGGSGTSGDGTSVGGTGAGTGTGSSGSSASAPAGTNGGVVVPVTGGATGGNGGSGGGTAGSTGGSGTAAGGSTGGSADGSTSGSTGGSSGGGAAGAVPANTAGTMNLPVCAAADVELSLTSNEQNYGPSQLPTFQLALTNTSGAACRINLGAKSAVLTVSSDGNSHVWSSGDCPRVVTAQWYAVPASGAPLTASFLWPRTTSAPGCTPGAGGAGVSPGTYVARAGVQGVPVQPSHQFKLAQFGS